MKNFPANYHSRMKLIHKVSKKSQLYLLKLIMDVRTKAFSKAFITISLYYYYYYFITSTLSSFSDKLKKVNLYYPCNEFSDIVDFKENQFALLPFSQNIYIITYWAYSTTHAFSFNNIYEMLCWYFRLPLEDVIENLC